MLRVESDISKQLNKGVEMKMSGEWWEHRDDDVKHVNHRWQVEGRVWNKDKDRSISIDWEVIRKGKMWESMLSFRRSDEWNHIETTSIHHGRLCLIGHVEKEKDCLFEGQISEEWCSNIENKTEMCVSTWAVRRTKDKRWKRMNRVNVMEGGEINQGETHIVSRKLLNKTKTRNSPSDGVKYTSDEWREWFRSEGPSSYERNEGWTS